MININTYKLKQNRKKDEKESTSNVGWAVLFYLYKSECRENHCIQK